LDYWTLLNDWTLLNASPNEFDDIVIWLSPHTLYNRMVTAGPYCIGPGTASNKLTGTTPAIVYSTGRNGGYGGTGIDELANPNRNSLNNDRVFISHMPTPSAAANGEFDDIVIWLSPNTLFNRMVTAGKLP